MALTPCDRARGRLATVRDLERDAKREHTAAVAKLERARRDDVHPRGELVKARDAASALLSKRRAQVRSAERAVAGACKPASSSLTARGKALRWLSSNRGTLENPPGSNRGGKITEAQVAAANGGSWLTGLPWCGVWALAAARAGGVKPPHGYRWASVELIEHDARAHVNGFRGWTRDASKVLRADLVILFGAGVHVETVREVDLKRGLVITDGGNTSSGNAGSQSNGGGAFRRIRPLRDVHGFALVNYPG